MRFSDTIKLAYTKLRTRKIRLFISVFISSLLFSILTAGSLVVTGALGSFTSFSNEGFSGRYLVSGVDGSYDMSKNPGSDPVLVARVEALEKAQKAEKKVVAKRLGIEYDEKTDIQLVYTSEDGSKSVDVTSQLAQQAFRELDAESTSRVDFARFKQQVPDAAVYYRALSRSAMRLDLPSLSLVENGVEKANTNQEMSGGGYSGSAGSLGLKGFSQEWNLMEAALLEPYLAEGQTLEVGADGSLPIIASYSAAQQVLKLPTLSKKATVEEKKQRLQEVRAKIASQTFQVCYRNITSTKDYKNAVQQQVDIKTNGSKKGYVKPDLIYKPSATLCAAPEVERDVRSAEVKKYQTNLTAFNRQFGEPEPKSQLVTFRIVGVTPDSPVAMMMSGGGTMGLMESLTMMVSSSIGARWVSPMPVLEKNLPAQDVFRVTSGPAFVPQQAYFAEFANANDARAALTNKSCQVPYMGALLREDIPTCTATVKGSPFMLAPFGSAALAIDDFKSVFRVAQLWAAAIIGGIAALMLIGMVGRIIADARKETAVFRATGASRLMIAQIYMMYTAFVALLIVLLSVAIGFGIALFVDANYGPDTSIQMALMFNAADLSKQFHFYAIELYDLGIIAASIFGAALIGSIIPISHNVRRNPIRDMREE